MCIVVLYAEFDMEVAPPKAYCKSKVKTAMRQQKPQFHSIAPAPTDQLSNTPPQEHPSKRAVSMRIDETRRDSWQKRAPRRGQLGTEVQVEVDVGKFLR